MKQATFEEPPRLAAGQHRPTRSISPSLPFLAARKQLSCRAMGFLTQRLGAQALSDLPFARPRSSDTPLYEICIRWVMRAEKVPLGERLAPYQTISKIDTTVRTAALSELKEAGNPAR